MDSDSGKVLSSGLDQLADLLEDVRADALDQPTPCADWKLGDLVDHVVASPSKFVTMARWRAAGLVGGARAPQPRVGFRLPVPRPTSS